MASLLQELCAGGCDTRQAGSTVVCPRTCRLTPVSINQPLTKAQMQTPHMPERFVAGSVDDQQAGELQVKLPPLPQLLSPRLHGSCRRWKAYME